MVPGRRHTKIRQQQPQHRLDAYPAGRQMGAAANRLSGNVNMRVAGAGLRVPVPCDQFLAGAVEQVVAVRECADVPALAAVLNELELMAEKELDVADAWRAQQQRVF